MSDGERRYATNFAIALGIMGDRRAAKTFGEVMRNPGGRLDPLVDYAYPNRLKALCIAGRIDISGAEDILLGILTDAGKSYVASLLKAKACDYSRYPGWVYPFSGSENGYREALFRWQWCLLSRFCLAEGTPTHIGVLRRGLRLQMLQSLASGRYAQYDEGLFRELCTARSETEICGCVSCQMFKVSAILLV